MRRDTCSLIQEAREVSKKTNGNSPRQINHHVRAKESLLDAGKYSSRQGGLTLQEAVCPAGFKSQYPQDVAPQKSSKKERSQLAYWEASLKLKDFSNYKLHVGKIRICAKYCMKRNYYQEPYSLPGLKVGGERNTSEHLLLLISASTRH